MVLSTSNIATVSWEISHTNVPGQPEGLPNLQLATELGRETALDHERCHSNLSLGNVCKLD